MTFECKKLRDAARDQTCVRCGNPIGVVGCHYTGVRRLSFGGGYGQKVHDFLIADLCPGCHLYMDSLSRDKEKRYEHSEEFLYYIALTWERRFIQGVIVVARLADPRALEPDPIPSTPAFLPRMAEVGDRAGEGPEAGTGHTGEAP